MVGVVSVEHTGQVGTRDGFCLSLLVRATGELAGGGVSWRWEGVEGECRERVRAALRGDPSGCANLIDLTSKYGP